MATSFDLVTIDAKDTLLLAAFWSAALNLHVNETEDVDRWIVLGSSEHPRRIGIQRITDLAHVEPEWSGPAKQRIHLDLACALQEFDAEVERLLALGARELRQRRSESYGNIATLADPEGNLFDLCAYISNVDNDVSIK